MFANVNFLFELFKKFASIRPHESNTHMEAIRALNTRRVIRVFGMAWRIKAGIHRATKWTV